MHNATPREILKRKKRISYPYFSSIFIDPSAFGQPKPGRCGDKLVLLRDELDTSGQRLDVSLSSNRHHLQALVGWRRDVDYGEARDERINLERCAARTIVGIDCHERVGIGGHRVDGVQVVIDRTTPGPGVEP
jgi:hypothetical protein